MGKYLKSYKKYPGGSLIVIKKYNMLQRLFWLFRKGRKPYNSLIVLDKPMHVGISKWNKFIYDYHIFVPKNPYRQHELKALQRLSKSCDSIKDYLIAINAIRPGTIDTDCLDAIRNNQNYKKIYLEMEPFQDIDK